MIDKVYSGIKTILRGHFNTIDLQRGQLDNTDEESPIIPAFLFIDFGQVDFEDKQDGRQEATLNIDMQIGISNLENTSDKIFTLIQQVYELLQDKSIKDGDCNITNGLRRTYIRQDNRERAYKVMEMGFRCRLYDLSLTPKYKKVTPLPSMEKEIELEKLVTVKN